MTLESKYGQPVDRRSLEDFIESNTRGNFEELLKDFDKERWDVTTAKMELQILHGNHNAAVSILKEFMQQPLLSPVGMQSNVSEVFGKRLANMLQYAGLHYVQDVADASDAMLLTIREFGMTNLKIVRTKIAEIKRKGAGVS